MNHYSYNYTASNLLRGRFAKDIHPLVAKFNNSLSFDWVLFPYDIVASKVHAEMLAKQKLITKEEEQEICQGLSDIFLTLNSKSPPDLDLAHEDIHSLIEKLLIDKIGDVGKKLHTGRSRNDQVAVDVKLYLRDAGQNINNHLSDLLSLIHQLCIKHTADIMPGYTHLQQAQPIYLGKYFQAYHSMFTRDKERLYDWHKRMNYSPLGAGALAGSQLPIDREYTAKALGFQGVVENTIDAVSDRDYIIEFINICAIMMMHFSRMAEDLIIWSTEEFNFLHLDDAFATGSSIMPNKKNPDVLELLRGKSGRVYGNLQAILTVMKGLPLSYNKDMQEDKELLFDTVNTVDICLQVALPFLESASFNTAKMSNAVHGGNLHATAIMEQLVLNGIPMRDAHHMVASWVKQAMEEDCPLDHIIKKSTFSHMYVNDNSEGLC